MICHINRCYSAETVMGRGREPEPKPPLGDYHGTTDQIGDHTWDDESYCECRQCKHHGTVKNFAVQELYVKDDDGKMFGPYSDIEEAKIDACRIDGIVIGE